MVECLVVLKRFDKMKRNLRLKFCLPLWSDKDLIKKLVENYDILDVIVSSSLANKFQSLSRSASDGPSMCHIKLRRGWNGQNISATLALFLEMRSDRTSKSIRSSSPLTFSDTNFPMGSLTPLSASQINLPSSSSATLETYKVPFIKSL